MGAKTLSALKDAWARAKLGGDSRVAHDAPLPADLLKAVNDAAGTAQTSWVFFLAQMAFFYITVASVTHKDLLLKTPVQLPLLQTQLSLEFFFQWGPYVFVLLHFGLLLQHEMLARKLKALNDALAPTEGNTLCSSSLRLELSSYFFAQSMAGPPRSPLLKALMRTMTFLTFGLLPLCLLLFFQIKFLPYHSEDVTSWQRGALFLDLAVVMALGTFLSFPDRPYLEGIFCIMRRRPARFAGAVFIWISALVLSLLVAVVPNGKLEKELLASPLCWKTKVLDRGNSPQRWACLLTAVLFDTQASPTEEDGAAGVFGRSLVVIDQDLVPDKEGEPEKFSLLLAKRNLSYARFDRSDLHRADLREANLSGASLSEANLRDARMGCVDWIQQQGCTILTGASLRGARLENVSLQYAALQRADLSGANLQGADLSRANLQGADLEHANLRGANLSQANLQGAKLVGASLQGADLSRAGLQGAEFTHANLQGTNLSYADLSGADLRHAKIWGAQALETAIRFADTTDVNLDAPSTDDLQALRKMVNNLTEKQRHRLQQKLALLLDEAKAKEWEGGDIEKAWHQIVKEFLIDDVKKRDLSDYLGDLACTDDSEAGGIFHGIMRRATSFHVYLKNWRAVMRQRSNQYIVSSDVLKESITYTFNGDHLRLHSRLTMPECRAAALPDIGLHLNELKRQADHIQEQTKRATENEGAPSALSEKP
jgi:uncharacterized protein YjbI with pentapeptide repeats